MNWEGEGLRTNQYAKKRNRGCREIVGWQAGLFQLGQERGLKGGGKRDEGLAEVSKNADWGR